MEKSSDSLACRTCLADVYSAPLCRRMSTMASHPVHVGEFVKFGEDFELHGEVRELRHAGRVLKLERIPLELLRLLVERQGRLVTREEIVERVWGKDVFFDTDNSINGAVRKLRHVLRDDPQQPRFVQ